MLNDNGVTENWSQELSSLSFHSDECGGPANSVLVAGWLIDLRLGKLEPSVSTAVTGARLSRNKCAAGGATKSTPCASSYARKGKYDIVAFFFFCMLIKM